VKNAENLPCNPDKCFLNVVASAYHPNASSGNVVIVGADRPDGSAEGDKGRVDGFVERGDVPAPKLIRGGTKMADKVPVQPEGSPGQRVVRSIKLDGLRRGDLLRISAKQTMRIASTGYNVFIGTRMILAPSPKDTDSKGFVNDVVSNGGEVTELNGFNCTRGQSAYEDPCRSDKAATVVIQRNPPEERGDPKPLFVNLVVSAAPKLTGADRNDRVTTESGDNPGWSATASRTSDPAGPSASADSWGRSYGASWEGLRPSAVRPPRVRGARAFANPTTPGRAFREGPAA